VQVNTAIGPESVMLTVENTGDKLTPQLVSTLAEPFQRGTGRVRTDHAGVGLGLAIVKSITQAHDGTLTITPRTGGGLHVTVQLPATPTHNLGRSATQRDTAILLTCGNPTQPDGIRRNRHAW
jgi:two-component system sensor histidine kinase VanS